MHKLMPMLHGMGCASPRQQWATIVDEYESSLDGSFVQ